MQARHAQEQPQAATRKSYISMTRCGVFHKESRGRQRRPAKKKKNGIQMERDCPVRTKKKKENCNCRKESSFPSNKAEAY